MKGENMKFQVVRFGWAVAVFWALVVFLVAIANLVFGGYGAPFLKAIDSIYPGYTYGQWGFGGVIVATLYAALDGLIMGIVFAWLYNRFTKSE